MLIPIPQTVARLQPYIKIFTIPGGMSSDIDAMVANPGDIASTNEIGTINMLECKLERDTNIWRELNTKRGGLPREVYPTLPTYGLTLRKIMLYVDPVTKKQESIMTLFGFNSTNSYNNGFDIISQHKPLQISIELSSPTDLTGNVVEGYPAPMTIHFIGVWLDGFPLKFEAAEATELVIAQEVTAKAAAVIVS